MLSAGLLLLFISILSTLYFFKYALAVFLVYKGIFLPARFNNIIAMAFGCKQNFRNRINVKVYFFRLLSTNANVRIIVYRYKMHSSLPSCYSKLILTFK